MNKTKKIVLELNQSEIDSFYIILREWLARDDREQTITFDAIHFGAAIKDEVTLEVREKYE